MARADVTHSKNAVHVTFRGDRRHPEPETAVIKFPGGFVEVSRTTDDQYWAHVAINTADQCDMSGLNQPGNIVNSRIGYDNEGYRKSGGEIPPIPLAEHIQHMAILVDPCPSKDDSSDDIEN